MSTTRVVVIGSGGREHALGWKLAQGSGREVIVAPGNAGIARELRCEPLQGAGVDGIVATARALQADLVVIGPEQPLVDGAADALAKAGIPCFGPIQAAARLEGSKSFMKSVCTRAGVATAGHLSTTRFEDARRFIDERARAGKGVVVKADGLCAGKGVVVCPRAPEAVEAVKEMLGAGGAPPRFGEASRTVVIEDMLPGEELSVFALCDGSDALLFGAARDHKRLQDGDRGPNTGGMGAVAPLDERHGVSPAFLARLRETVFLPVLDEMQARDAPFRGLLFAGLMVADGEAQVLEFNVRFGDPETEALLLSVDADLLPLFLDIARGERMTRTPLVGTQKAATVVVAAEGYPDAPKKGAVIEGLDDAEAVTDAKVFCAGVARQGDHFVTSGGRVLAVSARGATFDAALDRAYEAADKIKIAGAQMRRDIGHSVRGR